MQLILLRHAEAGEHDPKRYPDDRLRPLTSKGHREHRGVAEALLRMDVRFDRLLTSPLVRARETAEITAQVYGWRRGFEEVAALGDDFSISALLDVLEKYPPESRVCCVGHEPHLSEFAAACLARGAVRIDLPKSGVIGLEFESRPARAAGTLRYVFRPKQLLALCKES